MVLGAAVIGLLVGMTGAGGGALMTPMLILLFGITPTAAISSDLVASVVMRPFGALVHGRAGTVNYRLVMWMSLGSVPAAFLGAYLLHLLGGGKSTENTVEIILGVALLLGTVGMVLRFAFRRRASRDEEGYVKDVVARPVPTLLIGVVGGIIVGMTSVGSGSLMVVALLLLYPRLRANELVGTDLTQAVPLTLAAAGGALLFGHVDFSVTYALVIGGVPAVIIGSLFSSHVRDLYVRPVITFVIFISGLKYLGLGTTDLGWAAAITLLLAIAAWGGLSRLHARTPARSVQTA